MGRKLFAKRTTSYLLLSLLDCRQILVQVRLPHRHRRTRQVHFQVQQQSEVTIRHQETGSIHQKTQNKNEKRDINRASGNRLRDFPKWLEESTDNLEDTEVPARAHISHDSESERQTKVASRKNCVFFSLPTRPKLRSLLANPNHKGSLQKTHWRSSTSSRNVC